MSIELNLLIGIIIYILTEELLYYFTVKICSKKANYDCEKCGKWDCQYKSCQYYKNKNNKKEDFK